MPSKIYIEMPANYQTQLSNLVVLRLCPSTQECRPSLRLPQSKPAVYYYRRCKNRLSNKVINASGMHSVRSHPVAKTSAARLYKSKVYALLSSGDCQGTTHELVVCKARRSGR